MKDSPQNTWQQRMPLAFFAIWMGCLTGCWEEIKYEPSPKKVPTQAALIVNETATPEPLGVSPRVDPRRKSPANPPKSEEQLPELPPKPITAEPEQPEPIESVSTQPGVAEPTTAPPAETSPDPKQDNPVADAGRHSDSEPKSEPSQLRAGMPELQESEATANDEVPVPALPNEEPEHSATKPEEVESSIESLESQNTEDRDPVATESANDSEGADDDPFALFDSAKPETPEESSPDEASEQPQPKVKADLDVQEEIDLLFGDKPATTEASVPQPAPPMPVLSAVESEPKEQAISETTEVKESRVAEKGTDEEVVPNSSEQETTKVETSSTDTISPQPVEEIIPWEPSELPAPPSSKKKDISILVKPKSSVDHADVWRAASRWSMALALHAKGMKPKTYGSAWKSAESAAEVLTVKLPKVPEVENEQDAVSTIQAAMIESAGPELWQAIESKQGIPAGDLAELAVRTHRMLLTYSPSKPHFANEAAELTRLAASAELPRELWEPLITLMEEKGSYNDVKQAIFMLHRQVAKHYQK